MNNFDFIDNHNGATVMYRQQAQENIDYLFGKINKKHDEYCENLCNMPSKMPTKRGFLARWLSL